jgi:peptidoglycan/xylan/chitin deacetylase (PgdA/CDA1 family)
MSQRRALQLAIVVTAALIVVSTVGLLSTFRPQPADTPIAATVAALAPTPAPTPLPLPITSLHLPILMYHRLEEAEVDLDAEYRQLVVSPQAFLEQVSYLQQNGYHTITFAELVGAFNGQVSLPTNPVIITFDDGWDDIYYVGYPILRDHGMRATFFISTNWIENLEGTVSWDQIEEMSRGGMEFGSHSVTHPYLTTSEPDWRQFELEGSKSTLEEHIGQTITALAYPFGLYDDTVIAAVQKAGYLTACTIDQSWTVRADGLLTLPRLWVYDWTTLDDFAALLKGGA